MTPIQIVILLGVLIVIGSFLFNGFLFLYYTFFAILPTLFGGAFFAQSKEKTIQTMLSLSQVQPNETVVDLGSGDGSLVIAFAKQGAIAHGYEINPFLVYIARQNIKRAGLSSRAFVHLKNFWKEDLSQFDVVAIFGINYIMKRLESKLNNELSPETRILSNHFALPSWQYLKKEGDVLLYKKS